MKERLGNLAKTGVPELLHLIYEKGDAAGILDVINEPAKKRFYFKNGMPVAASSNILSEVLGRLLMSERIISQKDYETSLEVVLREKKKHGEVLISMGLITPTELEKFLMLQLKRRLFKVFGWKHGEYRYMKADTLPAAMDRKPLHPAPLILEGIALGFYPPPRAKEDLDRHLDSAFKISDTPGKYRPEDFNINLQEKRFLESFDGSKSLRELLGASDLLRGRANALALSFIITGVLKPAAPLAGEKPALEESAEAAASEAAGPERLNAELLFMKAKTALKDRNYKAAVDTLKEITGISPGEGEYWAYLGWAIYNEDPSRINEAEKIIKDAIELNAELDTAWYFLGKLSLATEDFEWAEKSFRTALIKNPWALESLAELKRIEIKKSAGETAAEKDARKKYMEAFAFLEDPFEEAPNLKYLELSPGRTNTLAAVVNNIKKKSGPVLLEGVEGAGKTAFCLELLKRLSGEKVLAAFLLKPDKKEIRLIRAINHDLGCAVDSSSVKDELLSLGMRVSQNRSQGGHAIIIIDEANELSLGGIKLVQYLARLKTLQIILVAGPYFSDSLKAPEFQELDNKLSCRYSLNPLTLEETKSYILKRLNGAKRALPTPSFSITTEALTLIFEESGGIPAEINRKSALMLEKAAHLNKTVLDIETAEPVSKRKEAPAPVASPAAPAVTHEETSWFEEPIPASLKESAHPEPFPEKPQEKPHHEETVKAPEEALEKRPPLMKEAVSGKAVPERAQELKSATKASAIISPPARREPEKGLGEAKGRVEPELVVKPSKGKSKTRAILILILIVLAGIFAVSYIMAYLQGPGENTEKTPVTTPGPLSPEVPKDIAAPWAGSDNVEQAPAAGSEKARDRAASLSTTAKMTGTAR